MDKTQAQTIVKNTFESPFDKSKFTHFIKNFLNHIEEDTHPGKLIPDAFNKDINSFLRIGKYNSGENKVDILVVRLKKKESIERARTMQRNFIAWYLNGSRGGEMKDAALVAFVSPNEADWRFSLVKMDYRFEEGKNGRMKVKEEFTPARRWSFLVGNNENSHTAQSRLVPIIADDEHDPTLTQLEEAFNIEKVTKEFFEKYHDLFIWTEETLDEIILKDRKTKDDFSDKGVNIIDFAKKLLGQIVFLYFLQKKGWFGVERDDDWGTGPKNFLRELFNGKHYKYTNFFNDILEPLFYEALAIQRTDDYYSKLNCKIPFLNGGLFDPINNYDWVHTDILLSNELFSNNHKTKEGDTGNGILDVFDRYNFTVKEDEPLEREVAVDPEMLGKVFENLLEVKDRKSKGTYYTPREIVHYMCQQSLINYLHSELNPETTTYEKLGEKQFDMLGNKAKKGQLDLTVEHRSNAEIPKEDIEILIQHGESIAENDATVGLTKSYSYKLPESIRQNAKLIDDKFANIKICDPAIGSGAFPVGMMAEIVKARNVLSAYVKDPKRSIYNFKRECIEKSLYGVDIDPGAVEIAKLRLWLSLVVDEDDIKRIKPLPNLDYKIVCGNSLLGVNKNLFNNKQFIELERLKPLLFNETNPEKKREYKEQIDKLISQITNGHSQFDFEVYFSDVFHEKKGFDVVIANPPYITFKGKQKVHAGKNEIEAYQKIYINSAEYKINSFALFLEKGTYLLTKNGTMTYIIPSSFLQNEYLRKIRKYLLSSFQLDKIITFSNKIFEAVTDSIILFVINAQPDKQSVGVIRKEDLNFDQISKVKYEQSEWNKTSDGVINLKTNSREDVVISRMEADSSDLNNFLKVYVGIVASGIKKFLSTEKINSQYKKYLQGRHINKYTINPAKLFVNFDVGKLHSNTDENVYLQPEKILIRKTGNVLIAAYDDNQFYTDQSIYNLYSKIGNNLNLKYIIALLNSSLINFYFNKKYITNPDVFPYIKGIHLERLPIKAVPQTQQKPFVEIVNKILAITKTNDYLENSTKQAEVRDYEKQIDQMVYKLYGLTDEEIRIVKGVSS